MGGAPHLEEVCSFTGMTGCLRESSLWRESGLHEEEEETKEEKSKAVAAGAVADDEDEGNPTANNAATFAIGNPVALDASADDLLTLGFISITTNLPSSGF